MSNLVCLVSFDKYGVTSVAACPHSIIKPSGYCVESSGMADTWWRGIHMEFWVVSETRIHTEIKGFSAWIL